MQLSVLFIGVELSLLALLAQLHEDAAKNKEKISRIDFLIATHY